MKKTVLFGTGNAAINFLMNDKEKREYVLVVDNDLKKHGKLFNDLVIKSPNEIRYYEFDEIVVASFFGLDIKRQLLNMNIEESKIILPPKNMLKSNPTPFKDEKTLKIATLLTKHIGKNAVERNLHLHIDWGTLLGVIRNNCILEWDDDVDFSSLIDDYDKIVFFVNEVCKKFDNKSVCLNPSFHKNKIVINVTSKDGSFNEFNIDIDFKEIKGDFAYQVSNPIWKNPSYHIEKLEKYKWNEDIIFIPSDVEKYLEYTYGRDWKIPKQNCSLNDYNLENILNG